MNITYNYERIPRRADCLQWAGDNTPDVMARLAQHGMIGEIFRDIYIQVYKDGSYSTTVNVGSWLVEGEDVKLRFYDDETHKLMYRPIVVERETEPTCISESIPKCTLHKDELERLRAFAREMIEECINQDTQSIGKDIILEIAGSCSLVATHFPSEPCGKLCACREKYGDVDFDLVGVECLRLTDFLKAHE